MWGVNRRRKAIDHTWAALRSIASWANPIEAHFGSLRQFTLANSNHRDHTVQIRVLHAVLAAQRRERARIRSERQQRWGRPRPEAA